MIAGAADTPAIRAPDEVDRREFGIWLRLNYSAMSALLPATDAMHRTRAEIQANANRLSRMGVDSEAMLRTIGFDPDALRLQPDGLRDVTLAQAQAPAPPPALAVPGFDDTGRTLLRALLTSEGFRRSLTGEGAAPAAALPSRFAASIDEAKLVHGRYLDLVGRDATAEQRAGLVANAGYDTIFEDAPIAPPSPAIVSGTDLADQLAVWLQYVALVATQTLEEIFSATAPDEAATFTALRGQISQGYATAPTLLALEEQQRREFSIWLLLNRFDMIEMLVTIADPNTGPMTPPPPLFLALRERCRTILSDLGLDTADLRVRETGLRGS